jgi:hypothetical protein
MDPTARDFFNDTCLDQAGYWDKQEVAELLLERYPDLGVVPPSVVLPSDREDDITAWWTASGHVSVLCSAPEFAPTGFSVKDFLVAMCEKYPGQLVFGYDWGGPTGPARTAAARYRLHTLEPDDANPMREVPGEKKPPLHLVCRSYRGAPLHLVYRS